MTTLERIEQQFQVTEPTAKLSFDGKYYWMHLGRELTKVEKAFGVLPERRIGVSLQGAVDIINRIYSLNLEIEE
jgi:hypothetical protein